jgi:hypothetical protein
VGLGLGCCEEVGEFGKELEFESRKLDGLRGIVIKGKAYLIMC